MLKIYNSKLDNGEQYQTLDIGNLITVSQKMWDSNDEKFNTGSYYDQCHICGKGIKTPKNGFTTIADLNPLNLVKLSDDDIAKKSGGYMNSFSIGSECGRKVKKAMKESNLDWKDWLIK
jgi:hypothetical protein